VSDPGLSLFRFGSQRRRWRAALQNLSAHQPPSCTRSVVECGTPAPLLPPKAALARRAPRPLGTPAAFLRAKRRGVRNASSAFAPESGAGAPRSKTSRHTSRVLAREASWSAERQFRFCPRKRRWRAALQNLSAHQPRSCTRIVTLLSCPSTANARVFSPCPRAKSLGRTLRLTDYQRPEPISSQRRPTTRPTIFVGPSVCACFSVDFSSWRMNSTGSLRLGRFSPTITILWVTHPEACRRRQLSPKCWGASTPKAPPGSTGSTEHRDGKSGIIIGTPALPIKGRIWRA
jgi:hypothetical protein